MASSEETSGQIIEDLMADQHTENQEGDMQDSTGDQTPDGLSVINNISKPQKSLRFAVNTIPLTDGLLSQNQQELYERVAHLEKRVREQEDEIICLKGALADVLRRVDTVEATRSAQNSILPSKPMVRTPRRSPAGQDRPKSSISALENVNALHRTSTPPSSRQSPRGASASSIKKWSSMSNSIETNGHSTPPHSTPSSQLNQAKRSTSHGSLSSKTSHSKGAKEPKFYEDEGYLKLFLKGRPVILHAPTSVTKFDCDKSDKKSAAVLNLEWVYGYRGRDCRSNLYTLPTREIVYFAAACVVLFNVEEHTQRFYLEHTDDIKCLAIHPNQITIATGQVAGHEKKEGVPHIRVWSSVNLQTLHVLGVEDGFSFQRAVCCLSFSKTDGGKLLCAVDDANDHTLSVWSVPASEDGKVHKLADTRASGDPVIACEFHPQEKNSIVCCGKGQITFWTFENGSLSKRAGIFERNEKPKFIICVTFADNGDVISGDSNGNIYVWGRGGQKITQAIVGAHAGPVFTLCVMNEKLYSGGGKDRKIYEWDCNYEKTGQEDEVEEQYGGVRMISQGPGNTTLVGTIRNTILKKDIDGKFKVITEGHVEELWGLAVESGRPQFLTCGSDCFLYMWDSQTNRAIWKKEINEPAHCCCFHPKFDVVAIGLQTGTWTVLDINEKKIIYVCTDGKEQHECIQYSPDGNLLAVGCRDNYIYIYKVEEDGWKYTRIGRCKGHSSFVTHIDFSCDGEILRSNSGDYEVLYWDTSDCKQHTSKDDIRDLEWATHNCTLAFNSIGIWPANADGTDINNCCKSHDNTLIASADDFGCVNLYNFPCQQPRAEGNVYRAHSSHVTNVAFLCDDTRLISTGGRDMSVMQWEVRR